MKFRSSTLVAAAILLPTVGLISLNLSSQAQSNPNQSTVLAQRSQRSPEEKAAKRQEKAAKFKEALGLSETQATQIEAIRESYRPQKEALREEGRALREGDASEEERQALRAKRQELRQQMYNDIKAELTPEQVQKLEELKAQRKGQKRGRR
ncbi:Spy/CpxP family protein refolding chaperone [Acaryochloris sp. IP29b_bin.148]|uniref:Spy/CpxP family protein refolding chaperone n=1 Tax=Acaryochloris sp. IP29b_bin.148 TaxID=2969218 RepID=UPI00261D3620|nr:Spy/CpxP family protein refolding chaperone [Acaryochloris sp. IP29b_bin.148]